MIASPSLPLLFTFFLLLAVVISSDQRAELCEDVGGRMRESSVLEDYRGRNFILAFTGIHCSGCATRLLRLTEVSRQFHVDVLVITPPTETSSDLKWAANYYPKLRFEAAPCSPCEFDYVLDTNSSKIFVLDSCSRLLHRYERSAEYLTHLRARFPLTYSCGQACNTERRKRVLGLDLPPVGCGPKKMLSSEELATPPQITQTNQYDAMSQKQQMQRNRQYKQVFQSGSHQQPQPLVPQPVVSVSYSSQHQQQYNNKFAQPVLQASQIPVQGQYQQQQIYSNSKPGIRVQGRYQKYQPDESPPSQQRSQFAAPSSNNPTQMPRNPAQDRYNIERLNDQRNQIARQREEHAHQLRLQNENIQRSSQHQLATQLETPLISNSDNDDDTISFTQAFRNQNYPQQQSANTFLTVTTGAPRATVPTTRRPPKTTKNPLVYANQPSVNNFGRRSYGRQLYESTYQIQQRRRNELAAQRQRVIQEKQRLELEQLKHQELQRQIAEQAERQAAAQAAYEQKLSSEKLEAAPLYHDENGPTETVDLTDYYDNVDEWTTAIPQVRLESPPSPEPLPANPAEHPEFLFDLPCNGFSDEICYQQQSQLETQEVHKCCQTRIILTDQCVPGRCSNVTNQLCCIQRLLQSKFKCCNDKKQSEVLFAGDSFSRCCFEGFIVEDDPCCPHAYSSQQWRSIYELCLPAISVDLSHVRVPQKVVAGLSTTVNFDFSKTDKWRFNCKYGGHVPQYSYFPPLPEEERTDQLTED